MSVSQLVHRFGRGLNISTTTGWIAMKFDKDIHVPVKTNCSNFGDSLTFQQSSRQISADIFLRYRPQWGLTVNMSACDLWEKDKCITKQQIIPTQLLFIVFKLLFSL